VSAGSARCASTPARCNSSTTNRQPVQASTASARPLSSSGDLVRGRTLAGLAAARARGRLGGRPRTLSPRKVELLRTLAADKSNSVTEICQTLGNSRTTFYRYVK
jgi:hypothetical protein